MPQTINTNTNLTQINIAAQKAKLLAAYQALVTGIGAELADTATFLLAGVSYTKAELSAHFQARIDAAKKTLAARTATHAVVADEQAIDAEAAQLRAAFKTYLEGRYGKQSAALQKFGYTPQKPTQRAAATKAKAVKQTVATRAARGTTGTKAKALIKGVVAPDAAPAAAPATAPATTSATAPATTPLAAK